LDIALFLNYSHLTSCRYVSYPEGTPELVEFDASNIEAELHKLWESQGLSQLGELAELEMVN